MLFGYDLSVIALIGIMLLIGIVKKNAIMMIDFALEAERERGKSPLEAIHEACLLRFRPIMMTTFAALGGGLPLASAPAPAPSCVSRSASPSSAACWCPSGSRSTPRPSSISISTGCRAVCAAGACPRGRRRMRHRPRRPGAAGDTDILTVALTLLVPPGFARNRLN